MIAIIRYCSLAWSIVAMIQYFLGAEMADWLFSAIMSIILRMDVLLEEKE